MTRREKSRPWKKILFRIRLGVSTRLSLLSSLALLSHMFFPFTSNCLSLRAVSCTGMGPEPAWKLSFFLDIDTLPPVVFAYPRPMTIFFPSYFCAKVVPAHCCLTFLTDDTVFSFAFFFCFLNNPSCPNIRTPHHTIYSHIFFYIYPSHSLPPTQPSFTPPPPNLFNPKWLKAHPSSAC